jgi:hypothetical protein
MKSSIAVLALVLASNVFADAAVRVCPTNVLNCRLEKTPYGAPRILLGSSVTQYDGTNSDEPSIPPSSCTIRTALEDNQGVIVNVSIDEVDQYVNIYSVKRPELGKVIEGEAAFTVTPGKAFFYRYGDSLLTCTLSK